MNIQEILNRHVEDLERMNDKELKTWLEPIIPSCRMPDEEAKAKKSLDANVENIDKLLKVLNQLPK